MTGAGFSPDEERLRTRVALAVSSVVCAFVVISIAVGLTSSKTHAHLGSKVAVLAAFGALAAWTAIRSWRKLTGAKRQSLAQTDVDGAL
ncbi:MAG: hypothetical protein M3Z95_05385 [Actinomycetota bacterium]|nr:hypothetical protein [Actinomycetota bacterium]